MIGIIKMAKLRGHVAESRLKLIVAGDSGKGKTGLLSTLANAGYNLGILDFDNGLDILFSYLNDDALDRVHYITLEDDIKNRRSAWGQFCKVLDDGWKDDQEDLGKIQDWDDTWFLVIDSGTKMGSAAMRATLSQGGKDINAQPTLPDYGEAGRKIINRITPLLSNKLKFHLIINTHLKSDKDDYDRTYYMPAFVGSASSIELPTLFNNVVRIDNKPNGEPFIRTKSDNKMGLKTSAPNELGKEAEFDLATFMKVIQENVKKKSAKS